MSAIHHGPALASLTTGLRRTVEGPGAPFPRYICKASWVSKSSSRRTNFPDLSPAASRDASRSIRHEVLTSHADWPGFILKRRGAEGDRQAADSAGCGPQGACWRVPSERIRQTYFESLLKPRSDPDPRIRRATPR